MVMQIFLFSSKNFILLAVTFKSLIHSELLFFKLINLFIFGCVGSSLLCAGFRCSEQGLLFVAVCDLLIAVASLVAEHELQGTWAQ